MVISFLVQHYIIMVNFLKVYGTPATALLLPGTARVISAGAHQHCATPDYQECGRIKLVSFFFFHSKTGLPVHCRTKYRWIGASGPDAFFFLRINAYMDFLMCLIISGLALALISALGLLDIKLKNKSNGVTHP